MRGGQGLLLFGRERRSKKGQEGSAIPNRGSKSSPWRAKGGGGTRQRSEGKNRKEREKDKVTEGKQRAKMKAENFDRRDDGHLHADSDTSLEHTHFL